MNTILILALLAVIGLYAWNSFKPGSKFDPKKVIKTLIITVVGILAIIFQPFNLERVDAGHVGISVNLTGSQRGVSDFEFKTGWVVYNSWFKQMFEFPTFQQHIEYPDQEVIMKGGFPATIRPSFNYNLIAGQVGDMFVNLRKPLKQVEQEWLYNAIMQSFMDVANTWDVDDIFNKRERFEASIIKEVTEKTKQWFIITQLRTNITPPASLKKAIEDKTKAVQEVQVAENMERVAKAEGNRKIAEEKADSAVTVINAQAAALAIKLKQLQITPEYIEYLKWINAAADVPRVPSTVLGDNKAIISLR